MSKVIIECKKQKEIPLKPFKMYLVSYFAIENNNAVSKIQERYIAIPTQESIILINIDTAKITYEIHSRFEDYYEILRDVTDEFELTIKK